MSKVQKVLNIISGINVYEGDDYLDEANHYWDALSRIKELAIREVETPITKEAGEES